MNCSNAQYSKEVPDEGPVKPRLDTVKQEGSIHAQGRLKLQLATLDQPEDACQFQRTIVVI